jgi:hypothetical protein
LQLPSNALLFLLLTALAAHLGQPTALTESNPPVSTPTPAPPLPARPKANWF